MLVGNEGAADEGAADEGAADEDNDKYFMSIFTLSRFRKDLMVLSVELFPEE